MNISYLARLGKIVRPTRLYLEVPLMSYHIYWNAEFCLHVPKLNRHQSFFRLKKDSEISVWFVLFSQQHRQFMLDQCYQNVS